MNAFTAPRLRLAAALAVVLVVAVSVEYQRYVERQQEGHQAKEQVMLALRVTGSKLDFARNRVRELGDETREFPEVYGEYHSSPAPR